MKPLTLVEPYLATNSVEQKQQSISYDLWLDSLRNLESLLQWVLDLDNYM